VQLLIDTHAHIYDARFDSDREDMMERARLSGVEAIIVPATKPAEFERVIELTRRYPEVKGALGVHPHHASEVDDVDLDMVERRAIEDKAIAIGEIGLDYYYDHAPRIVQWDVFRRQLQTARRLDLPAVIHNRESDDDLLRIIDEEQDGTLRFQLHCFSSPPEVLRRALELGGMISFTGNITFRKESLDDLVRMVPEDRLMIETDSPYMTPVPFRGRRNEPAHVALVADRIAEARGVDIDIIRDMTTRNARRFFRLASVATLLFFIGLLATSPPLLAQPQPVRPVDTANRRPPFEKLIGIGGHFASSTYISGSTTEADGIPGFGGWLSIAPLQPWGVNWLQIDVVYTGVEVPGSADSLYTAITNSLGDTGRPAPPNQHSTFDIALRFTANPRSIITLYGAIGLTKFHNEFGVDGYYISTGQPSFKDYIEDAWGWNLAAGITYNLETPYGTISPTAELRVMRIAGERPLPQRPREFFVSQPRIGILLYPNLYTIFR